MTDTNIVTLNTSSYNAIKSGNFRAEMFVENVLAESSLSEDRQHLIFDSESIERALKFCYIERYKKKLATAKTQSKRYGGDACSSISRDINKTEDSLC